MRPTVKGGELVSLRRRCGTCGRTQALNAVPGSAGLGRWRDVGGEWAARRWARKNLGRALRAAGLRESAAAMRLGTTGHHLQNGTARAVPWIADVLEEGPAFWPGADGESVPRHGCRFAVVPVEEALGEAEAPNGWETILWTPEDSGEDADDGAEGGAA